MLSHFRSSRSTTATPEGSVASIVSSTDTPSPPQKCGHTKPPLEYLADEEVPFALIPEGTRRTRFVVAITGATGATIAVRLLQALRALDIEVHLIMSKWAASTLRYETDVTVEQIKSLADHVYSPSDVSAPPSSGSFLHDGMIVVPCSMKTLAAIRIGFCDELISRAADVCLKENRKLLLAVRETPLSEIHLENMLFLRRAGAIIFPPLPAYYIRPESVDDLTNQTVGRMLDSMGVHTTGFERWSGLRK